MDDDEFSQCAQRPSPTPPPPESDGDDDSTPILPQQKHTAPVSLGEIVVEETDGEEMGQQTTSSAKRPRTTNDLTADRLRSPKHVIDARETVCILWNKLVHEEFGLDGPGPDSLWTRLPTLPAPHYDHVFNSIAEDISAGPLKNKVLLLSGMLTIIANNEQRVKDLKQIQEREEKQQKEERED